MTRLVRAAAVLRVAVLCLLPWRAGAVGFQTVLVPDPGNPPIELGIWYPRDAPARNERLFLDTQRVARDGAVAGNRLPLVVMSHGQGGRFSNHFDTAIALARAGFVAAALTHTGDNLHDQSRVIAIQDRPRQLHVVIDWLLHDWPMHGHIDPARVGVWGFSAGGFTALVAAGGVPDMSRIGPHCVTHPAEFACALITRSHVDFAKLPPIPAEAWVHDPHLRAAVIAAPAMGFTFDAAGLSHVRVPIQLWRAEQDHTLPQPFYAQAVRDALPSPPEYHVVANTDHLDFLAPCDQAKAQALPAICQSPPGFDRAAFHTMFDNDVVAFFRKNLM